MFKTNRLLIHCMLNLHNTFWAERTVNFTGLSQLPTFPSKPLVKGRWILTYRWVFQPISPRVRPKGPQKLFKFSPFLVSLREVNPENFRSLALTVYFLEAFKVFQILQNFCILRFLLILEAWIIKMTFLNALNLLYS